ncbi:hypothetical protein BDN70DRAFT_952153 [Pholiota conissans]|uniref:Nucleoside 2-deoxyribosyltransferase like protein n=1 Tax=Pholiota conissans TaxID=109636 RepID=A0A9P5YX19_9AGAR|nr:hypothetical protein BDN70DRAFT_952153 [Pholiota conissans]
MSAPKKYIPTRATEQARAILYTQPTNPKPAIAQVIYAPNHTTPLYPVSIFLAGSICQDKAPQWQLSAIAHLAHLPITIYNPRVSDWDPNLRQDAGEKRFKDQVLWELKNLQACDVIMMYLAPDEEGQAMDAPISLMEFGRFANDKRLIVGCPERFNRRGNVDITGKFYGTRVVDDFHTLVRETTRKLEVAIAIAKESAKAAKHCRR